MSEQQQEELNVGDLVEITSVGRIERLYGDDRCVVYVHGVEVPMLRGQVKRLPPEPKQEGAS